MLNYQGYLKRQKIIVVVTVLIFLFTSCTSCSRSSKAEARTDSSDNDPCNCGSITQETHEENHKSSINNAAKQEREYTQQELVQIANKLEQLFDDFEESVKESSAKALTSNAIVNSIGSDNSEELFKWVRDNTFFIPYKGSLRGAEGVLIDRLGNSLDRALLLYNLLNLAGYDVQLINGTLSKEQAEKILQKISPIPKDLFSYEVQPLSKSDKELIEKYSQEYNVNKETLLEAVKEKELNDKQRTRNISKRVNRLVPQILNLVEKFNKKDMTEEKNKIFKSIQDHWWVQFQKESEWIDLDPTLPDSFPGKTLTKFDKTTNPDDLDDSLYHKIKIKVIIEQWKNKSFNEHVVLSHTIQPSNHLGERIILYHNLADWPKDLNLFQVNEPLKTLKDLILQQKTWTPILQIDSDNIKNHSFKNSGDISEKSEKKKRARGVGGIMGGFQRTLTGTKSDEEEAKESFLTAEWLEYEIYSPGQPLRKIRREIFDLIGPSMRLKEEMAVPEIPKKLEMKRNLILLGKIEILPLFCQLSNEFIQNLADTEFLAYEDIILSVIHEETFREPENFINELNKVQKLPIPMYMLALNRYNLDNYIDTPNIFSYHSLLRENKEGYIDSYEAFDLVENKVAVGMDKIEDSFQIRLRQGIYDSIAESVFVTGKGEEDHLSKFYAETKKQGIEWLMLRNPEDISLQKSVLPEDVTARINMELSKGYIIIVPEKEVPIEGKQVIKWWRINPENGDTLIIGKLGWGQALTTYVEQVEIIMQLHGYISLLSDILKCIEITAIEILGTRPKEYTFFDCIAVIVCKQLYKEFEKYCDLETNWTNFILKQLAGFLAGEFCKKFIDEVY